MPADADAAAGRFPRPGRYLIPGQTPGRAQVIAVAALLAFVVHLLFAQLTLILAIVFHLITKLTRWRPQWLIVPACAGAVWVLAIGPVQAAARFTQGPAKIVAYIASTVGHLGRLGSPGSAYMGMGQWLPRQFPLALIAASAEAAIAAWLAWLHADEWQLPGYRSGLLIMARRAYLTRFIRAGGVVTRDGACLGIDTGSGRRSAVAWAEAEGGVLCVGSPGSGTTTTSFQLAHAAIRLRKPVVVVDLSGSRALAESLAAVCAATRTSLQLFPGGGARYYDPLRGGDPARRTSLVMGMADWEGTPDTYRRTCAAYLTDLFAVLDAAPGDPQLPVLDEVVHLLRPEALRARMNCVPGYHPRRQALAERVAVSAGLLEADPHSAATLVDQLDELRASTIGSWLVPGPGSRVRLGRVVRERAVALFSLDRSVYGRAAVTMASLVAHDVLAVCAELGQIGVPGDALAWFDQCGPLPDGTMSQLVSRGGAAGVAVLLASTVPEQVRQLADEVNVLVLHRLSDPVTAGQFAGLTGEQFAPPGPDNAMTGGQPAVGALPAYAPAAPYGGPAVPYGSPAAPYGSPAALYGAPADHAQAPAPQPPKLGQLGPFGLVRGPVVPASSLRRLGVGEHVLVVHEPERRLVASGRTVPARIPESAVRPPASWQAITGGRDRISGGGWREGAGTVLTGALSRPRRLFRSGAGIGAGLRQARTGQGRLRAGQGRPWPRGGTGITAALRKGRIR